MQLLQKEGTPSRSQQPTRRYAEAQSRTCALASNDQLDLRQAKSERKGTHHRPEPAQANQGGLKDNAAITLENAANYTISYFPGKPSNITICILHQPGDRGGSEMRMHWWWLFAGLACIALTEGSHIPIQTHTPKQEQALRPSLEHPALHLTNCSSIETCRSPKKKGVKERYSALVRGADRACNNIFHLATFPEEVTNVGICVVAEAQRVTASAAWHRHTSTAAEGTLHDFGLSRDMS